MARKPYPGERPANWKMPEALPATGQSPGAKSGSSLSGTRIILIVVAAFGGFVLLLVLVAIGQSLGWIETPPPEPAALPTSSQAATQPKPDPSPSETEDEDDGTFVLDSTKQALWIIRSKDGIKAKLKDPDSAEFRNVHYYSGSGGPVVCGEVNAKNSYGGYNGFEPFVASGDELAWLASELASPEEVFGKLCVRAPGDTE